MENLEKKSLIELSDQEIIEIEGGMLEILVAGAALAGALYGAGYACGQAYYYLSH